MANDEDRVGDEARRHVAQAHGGSDPPRFVLRQRNRPGGLLAKLSGVGRLGARLASLGAGPVDRVKLFAAPFVLLLAARLGVAGRARVTASITAFGRTAGCTVAYVSQLVLLEAIFLDGDYAVDPLHEPQTIVDVGSNVGVSIVYFRLRFPDARIIGVEPDPVAFTLLRRNVAQLPNVTVHHAAVGEREGTATFWSSPGATASSLEHTHDAQRPVDVPVHTLERLLRDAGVDHVDILKLVVEGSEFRALRSLGDLRRVDAITGEIVFVDGDPERSPEAFRRLLADFDVNLREDKGDGFWQFHAHRRGA
jgi:FkbM family methyltransferase